MPAFFRLNPGLYQRLKEVLGEARVWPVALRHAGPDEPKKAIYDLDQRLWAPLGEAEIFVANKAPVKVEILGYVGFDWTAEGEFRADAKDGHFILIELGDLHALAFGPNKRSSGAKLYLQKFNDRLLHELVHARDCVFDPVCAATNRILKAPGLIPDPTKLEGEAAEDPKDDYIPGGVRVRDYFTRAEIRAYAHGFAKDILARIGRKTLHTRVKSAVQDRCSSKTIHDMIMKTKYPNWVVSLSSEQARELYRLTAAEVYRSLMERGLCK